MISICITIKNRSRVLVGDRELQLFPNCVHSIVGNLPANLDAELVVCDWASDDWPLGEWLPQAAEALPLTIVTADGPFSRGRGLNLAARTSCGDELLFLDADLLLSSEVFTRGREVVKRGQAYFPMLFSYDDPDHTTGYWRRFGLGICMVSRATFEVVGGWPEYTRWGKEDDDFHARVAGVTQVVREEVPGFYHQWHPEDILFKDRYAERSIEEIAELEKVAATCAELEQALPRGASLILLDEDRFGNLQRVARDARPFLEINGLYGGPPPDGEVAARELRRMVREGSRFVAVTWIANWWLEHYAELRDYLEREGTLVVENERLRLYEMTA